MSNLTITLDDQGNLRVDVDGYTLTPLQSIHLDAGSDFIRNLARVRVHLPRIPRGTDPATAASLLVRMDQIREKLAKFGSHVEVLTSDTVPSMQAVRMEDED